MIFNTAQPLRVKHVHGFGRNHVEHRNASLPKLKASGLSPVLICFAQWVTRQALVTPLLIHSSQQGRAQKSCLPEILPSPRVFGASPNPKLTGSQHSLRRLLGLARFTNSFEQGQWTCSFFGECGWWWSTRNGHLQHLGKEKRNFGFSSPQKSNSYLVKGPNSCARYSSSTSFLDPYPTPCTGFGMGPCRTTYISTE